MFIYWSTLRFFWDLLCCDPLPAWSCLCSGLNFATMRPPSATSLSSGLLAHSGITGVNPPGIPMVAAALPISRVRLSHCRRCEKGHAQFAPSGRLGWRHVGDADWLTTSGACVQRDAVQRPSTQSLSTCFFHATYVYDRSAAGTFLSQVMVTGLFLYPIPFLPQALYFSPFLVLSSLLFTFLNCNYLAFIYPLE